MRGWRSLASLSRVLSTIQILHVRKMPFYAVARGHKPGIYESWPECQKQINGFHCARYKKFSTKDEAEEFVQENAASNPVVDRREKPATERENKGSEKEKASEPSPDKRKRDDSSDSDEDSNGPSVVKKLNTGDSGGSDKTKFSTDSDGFLIVYTDGACEFNGRNGAKAGVGVYFGKDHPLNVSEPVKGRATNNTAEIQAASFALELAKASGFSKVSIHTDSQFMINCMTSWLKNWKKKNWVKSDGEPVKNKEDLIALDAASEDLAVKWVHVKGHAGHEGNEIADKLARQGAKLYKADPDA
ncbi:ribonuclease H1-like isoform X2 [Homarus americanus]|uniref:ribonuclease H1-like isoform X2 n=1 Tax=Homarus americanus TaxID=6706 RepID=UPI001C481C87|nr:ribonuclease H1-like isoform X2 [Homarus americanus]